MHLSRSMRAHSDIALISAIDIGVLILIYWLIMSKLR